MEVFLCSKFARFHIFINDGRLFPSTINKKYNDSEGHMKTAEEWFTDYNASHQNKTNKLIHWVCVPTILYSIIGALMHFNALLTAGLIVLSLVFYKRMDLVLAVAMAALFSVMVAIIAISPVGMKFYFAVFVLAWIGQFYGHKVEGKKPSFFTDLQFLFIGPAWCMDALLTKLLPTKWKPRNPLKKINFGHVNPDAFNQEHHPLAEPKAPEPRYYS